VGGRKGVDAGDEPGHDGRGRLQKAADSLLDSHPILIRLRRARFLKDFPVKPPLVEPG